MTNIIRIDVAGAIADLESEIARNKTMFHKAITRRDFKVAKHHRYWVVYYAQQKAYIESLTPDDIAAMARKANEDGDTVVTDTVQLANRTPRFHTPVINYTGTRKINMIWVKS